MNAEYLEKLDRVKLQSSTTALKSVNKLALPKVVEISDKSFSGLGPKIHRDACKKLDKLKEKYGDQLTHLVALSVREIWFSLFQGASSVALMIAEGEMGDSDHTQNLATAEGYGENEGIAWTLYGHLAETPASHQQTAIQDYGLFKGRPSIYDILDAAALYWFAQAGASYRAGNVEGAFDWIAEAYEASLLALIDPVSSDLVMEAHSARAALGAKKMLSNNTKQKEKLAVRGCWDAWHKSPEKYKSKAAFARDMRDKFESLESQPVIENWCRIWAKEAKTSAS